MRRNLIKAAAAVSAAAVLLAGCASSGSTADTAQSTAQETSAYTSADSEESSAAQTGTGTASSVPAASISTLSSGEISTNLSRVDMSKWMYNTDDDVWYQLNIQYAENSPDENYDSLAIFVPGAYMTGTENGDGTYTCTVNTDAQVEGYTAETAPIVLPVNTPGYSAQAELTEYTDVTDYTKAGFVYVHIACRGRDAGAPYGVVDLKAGIRYLRYNNGTVPGDMDRIFSFGMSGGGAQSALLGATGDSSLYDAYLEEVGAVTGVSDAVLGSASWCPITSLDSADGAYEWNMGSTRSGLSDEEQQISDALASSFGDYINSLGLTDEDGNALTLETSEDGIYQAGSYYDYIVGVIENSLENFISDTEWPYDASSSSGQGMGQGGPGGGGMPTGEKPDGMPGGMPDTVKEASAESSTEDAESTADSMNQSEERDNITRNEAAASLDLSGTYETPQDYIDALNADGEWVSYDSSTGQVTITSLEDFAKAMKTASKNLGAFDQLDAGQGENTLFGYGDGKGAHFDSALSEILNEIGSDYADDYASDLTKTDSVGNTVQTRLAMYSPLYYLVSSQEGYQTSNVAKYWRIRSGLSQSDTAVTTEVNLALAASEYPGVSDVDFATVWGLQHTMAERSGDSTENFITWVNNCVAASQNQ